MPVQSLLNPRSVAIVGASEKIGPGFNAFNALEFVGFAGEIHLINPRSPTLFGRKTAASLDEVEGPVDAVFVAVAADAVLDVAQQAARKGAGALAILSSGFGETEDGKKAQDELARLCLAHDIAVCGPNCLGLLNFVGNSALFGTSLPDRVTKGGVAAIVLKLGGHTGAHMTYLFHLVSPPLTVVALRAAERRTIARFAFAAALPVAAFLNAHWFTFDMARIARAEAVFARAATAIAAAKHPAATTEFAPLLLAAGVPPIETGHTEYFRAVAPPWYLAPLWSAMPPLEAAQTRFTKGFRSAVDAEAFDLVIADRRGLDLLSADALAGRYRPVEPFELDLAWAQQSWPADIWRPIRSTE